MTFLPIIQLTARGYSMIRKLMIKVSMFGDLSFSLGEKSYIPKDHLSKHLCNLLEVFVYYHKHPISKHQLIDMFWSDSINPDSALKFSIHRLRQLLMQQDIFQQNNLILTNQNGYQLNTEDFEFIIDKDQVDALMHQSMVSTITVIDKLRIQNQLVNLLGNPFLQNSTNDLWVNPIREHYFNIHHRSLTSLIDDQFTQGKFDRVLELSNYGKRISFHYEDFHYYYILALIEMRKFHEAMEYYQKTAQDFLDYFKSPLSSKIKNLYSIVLSHEQKEHLQLSELLVDLEEHAKDGSYYCEYEIFKRYYQIALRASERNQSTYFVVLINLVSKANHHEISMMMKGLISSIQSSLRKGDVFSRMNSTQCILLLPCEQYHDVQMVVSRVQKKYSSTPGSRKGKLEYSIRKLGK